MKRYSLTESHCNIGRENHIARTSLAVVARWTRKKKKRKDVGGVVRDSSVVAPEETDLAGSSEMMCELKLNVIVMDVQVFPTIISLGHVQSIQ